MFGDIAAPPPLTGPALRELAEMMERNTEAADGVMPAGYTYLGQFIDHDVTFDPTPVSDKFGDEQARLSFRTPRLDLDSLYGSGPRDQPYLYVSRDRADRGVKLLEGTTIQPGGGLLAIDDLPRNQDNCALIGDPRNDENIIISQLHLLFIRFHNNVVDHLRNTKGLAGSELFRRARQSVCWHYQWIVVDDFLPRVVGDDMTKSVLRARRCFQPGREPFIPVEFSAAAYRFGHSLVRDSYDINPGRRDVQLFGGPGQHLSPLRNLAGLRPVPPGLVIDWSFFFEVSDRTPQKARRIDTNFAAGLWNLPAAPGEDRQQLPRLNLQRARNLELPTGQAVADKMMALHDEEPSLQVRPLTDEELGLSGLPTAFRAPVRAATPLWYYILCEAMKSETRGKTLGPVGGRIVAEVLVELLKSDPQSYFNAAPAGWKPDLKTGGPFKMADLVNFEPSPP